MSGSANACLSCGADGLADLAVPDGLPGVSSDLKPCPSAGPLACCASCGHVQKRPEPAWLGTVAKIQDKYEMYPWSGGVEPAAFAPGRIEPRSMALLRQALAVRDVPAGGSVLDAGCGNGAVLRALSVLRPGLRLSGLDVDDRFEPQLRTIHGFQRLYAPAASRVEERFDAVTCVHMLEHLTTPTPAALAELARLLRPGGWLLVQVPDMRANPFDLVVTDHASHFTGATLSAAVGRAALRVACVGAHWLPGQTGLLAEAGPALPVAASAGESRACTQQHLDWLAAVMGDAQERSRPGAIAVFGTGIAASWLAGALGEGAGAFVDEDPSRQGRRHLGRDVLSLAAVAVGATVYVALPPRRAASVAARLRADRPDVAFVEPPAALGGG